MSRLPARFGFFVLSLCLLAFAFHASAAQAHAQSNATPSPTPQQTPTPQTDPPGTITGDTRTPTQGPTATRPTPAQPTTAQPLAPGDPGYVPPVRQDVESIESILNAVYASISGAKGQARDWNRFRSLFVPGARLIPTVKRPRGDYTTRVLTPDEFIASSGKFMEEQGFYEHAIANHVETFGNIAQVFSVYEGRHATSDPKPFVRGINSIQLMNDGKRWWVVTIFWQAEDEANPIPQKYLTAQKK
ncbi:MAG TPA: hypothetical protein VGW12_01080 [Pyrinomonadaceae bacterium]|nr:hypothetical protein [Pyrinomonadaceae bacterium]